MYIYIFMFFLYVYIYIYIKFIISRYTYIKSILKLILCIYIYMLMFLFKKKKKRKLEHVAIWPKISLLNLLWATQILSILLSLSRHLFFFLSFFFLFLFFPLLGSLKNCYSPSILFFLAITDNLFSSRWVSPFWQN